MSLGTKHDSGKPPVTLIPSEFILGLAEVFGKGALKYGRHNFRDGIEISRTLDAALRHILAFSEREDLDPETGLSHLFHAGCSLAMCAYNLKNHPDLDDRPKRG
jgi:hypothetical protein